jgi:DNA polymerase-3 subunit delta
MSTVTTLTGENSFLLQQALSSHLKAFIAEHGDMAVEHIDGEEVEYDRMREALESLPFLASSKLVVLRRPSANKQFVEHAERLLTQLAETTRVLIIEPKLDKRSSYYKYLLKQTDYHEFTELDEIGLSKWLQQEAKVAGAILSPADARYLIERVGVNQRLLSNELAKLVSYDNHITRQTIELLVEPTSQSSIFDLIDAAFAGNVRRATTLYDEQRKQGVEPQQVIAMLSWQMHILALVKTAGERDPATIAKEAKLNPFVVRKSTGIARRLSLSELRTLVHEVAQLDARLKSQGIDADEAVRNLILRLSGI